MLVNVWVVIEISHLLTVSQLNQSKNWLCISEAVHEEREKKNDNVREQLLIKPLSSSLYLQTEPDSRHEIKEAKEMEVQLKWAILI